MVKKVVIIFGVIITSIILISAYVLYPSVSPFDEIHDEDGDGYPDATDIYPDNPLEWKDSDLDGLGDNSDAFPNDDTEWDDTDNDGYGDNSDVFPFNSTEWMDSDNDDYGDNCDMFPEDFSEWNDTDSDGIGDNEDILKSGNAKIKISITEFTSDVQIDGMQSDADTYFKISLDEDNNGVFDYIIETPTHINETWFRMCPDDVLIQDIPDNTTVIRFQIIVYDAVESLKSNNDSIVDYTNDTSTKYITYIVYQPFNQNWAEDGFIDSPQIFSNELDCMIEFQIELVA